MDNLICEKMKAEKRSNEYLSEESPPSHSWSPFESQKLNKNRLLSIILIFDSMKDLSFMMKNESNLEN